MLYFIKANKLHRYPTPSRCPAKYENEQLRDTIPHSVEECDYCLRLWPGKEK